MRDRPIADYGLDDLDEWLRKNPEQTITFQYQEGGFTVLAGDPREFRATLKKPIGSKMGWAAESLTHLIWSLYTNQP